MLARGEARPQLLSRQGAAVLPYDIAELNTSSAGAGELQASTSTSSSVGQELSDFDHMKWRQEHPDWSLDSVVTAAENFQREQYGNEIIEYNGFRWRRMMPPTIRAGETVPSYPKVEGRKEAHMTIQFFPDELDYANAILHPLAPQSGSFLEHFTRACLAADSENYLLLRPALLVLMEKYPADAERLAMERHDRGADRPASGSQKRDLSPGTGN